jgi:DNA primase
MSDSVQDLSAEFDLESWLDRESLSFRKTRGKSGMQLQIRECPVCGSTSSKVYLNAESGVGNCFKCDARFTKFSFVFATLHNFVPEKGESKEEWRTTFDHIKDALRDQGWVGDRNANNMPMEYEKAKFPSSFALPNAEGQNLIYLEERGIDGETAKYFHLRFCEEGWWNFTKEDGSTGGQKFDNRIIIPIYDLDGTFVTYQGRDVTGTQIDQKYLFPKGLPGTGRYLLNGQNAVKAKRIALVEGFFDVAATRKAFNDTVEFRSVVPVGSFGKHLSHGQTDSDDQLSRLLTLQKEGLEEITIMWDGEPKALAAALEAAEMLKRHHFKMRIALLPFDKDPNEVDAEVVRTAYRDAVPYTSALKMKWDLQNPYKDAERRKLKQAINPI